MGQANPVFVALFFSLWLAGMGWFFFFGWHVAPAALRRWADEENYRIIERKWPGLFDAIFFAKSNGNAVYRVVVRDKAGQCRSGLVRVGGARGCFWLSVQRCPVDVRWDLAKRSRKSATRPAATQAKNDLWDRELDCCDDASS
jgi:hypothetical protein